MPHTRRSYGQTCLLARALDVVGERWTLLLVRELLSGPKRFTELHGALVGMGTNLLSDRLKELTAAGVVERTPESTRTRPVYRLSELGEGLRPMMKELFTWGATGGAAPASGEQVFVSASRAFPLFYDVTVRPDWTAVVEMNIPGDEFQMHVHDGRVEVHEAGAASPDLLIVAKRGAWNDVANGNSSIEAEVGRGRIRIEGATDDVEAFRAVFGLST